MANFDDALDEYRKQRDALRGFQGQIQKKINERNKLDREIRVDTKRYNSLYRKLLAAANDLAPALQAEVNGSAVTFGAKMAAEEVQTPVSAKTLAKLEAPATMRPVEEDKGSAGEDTEVQGTGVQEQDEAPVESVDASVDDGVEREAPASV